MTYYILDDENNPIALGHDYFDLESDIKSGILEKWGEFMERREKTRVALDEIDGYVVSTVFLGICHRFGGNGAPILFETMIFDNDKGMGEHQYQERFTTWDKAVKGHQDAIAWLKSKILREKEDKNE